MGFGVEFKVAIAKCMSYADLILGQALRVKF